MNLYLELWRNSRLANKRHPMYDKNTAAKMFVYIGVLFWIGYLIFFACLMAIGLQDEEVESYHIINSGLIIFLLIDIVLRLVFQKTPTQEMKPYLMLPIRRQRLIDMLLIRSGLDTFNLFWLSFFLPFAILCVARFYGITGVLTYCLGIWLLMIANNYWYLLCRTLTNEHIVWIAIPLTLYGALIAAIFIPDESPVLDAFLNLGEGFITSNPLYFLPVIAVIALLWYLNHHLMQKISYKELSKTEDTTIQVKNVSEYRFLDRYGEVGEYMRLELKLLLRNKVCRRQIYMILLVIGIFGFLLGFTDAYSGSIKVFFILYNYVLMGIMLTSPLMSYEGNYIDILMSRKESIYALLRAKYILYSLAQILPFASMIPGIISGKLDLLTCLMWLVFVPGPIYFTLFQLAVYNNKTLPLNTKLATRQNGNTALQSLITAGSFFIPLGIYSLFTALMDNDYAAWGMIAIGLGFISTSSWWLKNVYHRFMKRRYRNIEGFQNSREKI